MLPHNIPKYIEVGDCWQWSGGQDGRGYGVAWDPNRKKQFKAYRLVYEYLVGEIPPSMELDHLCKNTLCVNPDHLEVVTHQENARRGTQGLYLKQRTHCPQGHAYAEFEVRYPSNPGSRYCRACLKVHAQWRRDRLKAERVLSIVLG